MSKILIIEDNNEINGLLSELISNIGHQVVSAYSGPEGLRLFREDSFSLILLDLMLPGKSGEEILVEMRSNSNIPIIVVSAKSDIDEKVKLLESGANDYITKPFDTREVAARIEIQLRNSIYSDSAFVSYGELKISSINRTVMVNDSEIVLTRHEFNILELLIKHPQKVYSKQELYEQAWDEMYLGEDKTLNVHISNIRKKIKEYTDTEYIETVWGIGFRIKGLAVGGRR